MEKFEKRIYKDKRRMRTYRNVDLVYNKDTKKERIKYVYLCDIYKYKRRRYKYLGNEYSNNRYGVGILTENNYYYYNEVMVSPKRITQNTLLRLKNFFTAPYKFTPRSKICISETLTNKNEPIVQFLTIVGATLGFNLIWTSMDRMLKRVNLEFPRVSIGEFSKWKRKRIFNLLREKGMFVFLQDDEWYEKLSLKNERSRKSIIECALGIIYMDILRMNHDNLQTYLEKVEKGLPIKHYMSKEERAEFNRKKEEEEKMNKLHPVTFLKKDSVLGEIEMVNILRLWETQNQYNNSVENNKEIKNETK